MELERALAEAVVARARESEPSACAVLLRGSYLTGAATELSDLDVSVVTRDAPRTPHRMWFEDRRGLPPLHVSLGAQTVDAWLARRSSPARWALGFRALDAAAYLWATEAARAALGDPPSVERPPAAPALDDLVENVVKVESRWRRGDEIGVRLDARVVGQVVPPLLATLNEPRVVRTEREAVAEALAFAVAPGGYADALVTCLGLRAAAARDVVEASRALGLGMLALLRERKPDADPRPDVASLLADGSLERHVRAALGP